MQKSVKSTAEEKFAAIQKKDKQALTDREKTRQAEAKHTAKLRASAWPNRRPMKKSPRRPTPRKRLARNNRCPKHNDVNSIDRNGRHGSRRVGCFRRNS